MSKGRNGDGTLSEERKACEERQAASHRQDSHRQGQPFRPAHPSIPPHLPHPIPSQLALSAERPMTDTMPEGCASAAACMLSPRSFTSLTPSSKPSAPA